MQTLHIASQTALLSVTCTLLEINQMTHLPLNPQSLSEADFKKRHEQWQMENQDAIDAYNEHVERHGVFSKVVGTFASPQEKEQNHPCASANGRHPSLPDLSG